MLERLNLGRPGRVIGWDGKPVTLGDLPARDARWSKKRKAQIVAAVRGNLLSFDEARQRYGLSRLEFAAWENELLALAAERHRAREDREFRVLVHEASVAARWRKRAG